MKHFTFIKSLLVILFIAGTGYSGSGQIPETFSFQMFISDNSGNPVPDGAYNVSLLFYNTPSGGLPVLNLDQETINVSGGLANIVLGGQAGLNLPVHSPLFVELSIGDGDAMSPRMAVVPSLQSQVSRSVFGTLNIFPSEGPVGLGTLNPTAQLEVEGDAIFNGPVSMGNLAETGITSQINLVTQSGGNNNLGIISTVELSEFYLKPEIFKNDINLFDSSGEEVFSVNANDGTSRQIGLASFNGGLQVGTDLSHFYAKNDGEFGIKNNDEDLFSVNPTGFGTFGGGLRVGTGSSYVNFDQTGRINLFGDGGLAADFDPNGTNFLYNPTSFRNDIFVGESDTSYFIANKSGSFGSVHNGQWGALFDPHGNSFINTPLYLYPGMVIGSTGKPYTSFFNDGIIFKDSTGQTNAQILYDGSIEGTSLAVSGSKLFKIDHPLDPENKYLLHRSIESNDRLNLYNGNIILNNNGEAEVELPAWFEELNEDYRYQLTAIGAPGPNLYIAQKINNNTFKISGGTADMEVSWQVTGKRKDKYANNQPALVEVLKESPELSAKFKME